MKKTAAVVLCAAMMLTACGGASTTETTAAGSQAAGSEAASSAEETKAASGDAQKLVLSTYGLSEDISEEEVYTPFENEFSCEIVTETGGTNDRYTKCRGRTGCSVHYQQHRYHLQPGAYRI